MFHWNHWKLNLYFNMFFTVILRKPAKTGLLLIQGDLSLDVQLYNHPGMLICWIFPDWGIWFKLHIAVRLIRLQDIKL